MVINYLPPNGVICQTYPMLLDIGRRVQALYTTVSCDKPTISCVRACVDVCKFESEGCVCVRSSIIPDETRPEAHVGPPWWLPWLPITPAGICSEHPSHSPCILAPEAQGAW